jgi:hypothetical protein
MSSTESAQPVGLGLSEGLGLAPERAAAVSDAILAIVAEIEAAAFSDPADILAQKLDELRALATSLKA